MTLEQLYTDNIRNTLNKIFIGIRQELNVKCEIDFYTLLLPVSRPPIDICHV